MPAHPASPTRTSLRELVTMSLLTAVLFATQVALAPLPNVEISSLLIALYTIFFRRKALVMIYGFVLLEGLLYGFGLWWINYLYVWAVLWALAMCFRRMRGVLGWTVLLAAFGMGFGLLCSVPYLVMGGPKAAFAYWLSGIPFDLVHGAGNAVVALALFAPLRALFERLRSDQYRNE